MVGDGITDDHAAFQDAINAALVAGGTVFIPKYMKVYLGTSAANKIVCTAAALSSHISIRGECTENDTSGSSITGNFADYLIDTFANGFQAVRSFHGINIQNYHAAGSGLKLNNAVTASINLCTIQAGAVGIRAGCNDVADPGYLTTFNTSITNCIIKGPWPVAPTGSVGVILAQGVFQNNRVTNWAEGLRAYNVGVQITGNALETNDTAMVLGVDDTGANSQLTSGLVGGNSFENNLTAVWLKNFSGHYNNAISSNGPGPVYGLRITNITASIVSGNVSGNFSNACIAFDGNCVNTLCGGLIAVNTGSGVAWTMPTGSNALGLVCDPVSNNCPALVHTVAAVTGISAPVEDMVRNVSDGTNGLGWGDPITNTGTHTTHYKVRYNGGGWTVMGK